MIVDNSNDNPVSSPLFKSRMLFAKEFIRRIFLCNGVDWTPCYPGLDEEDNFSNEILEAVIRTRQNARLLIIDQFDGWFTRGNRDVDYKNFKQFLESITYMYCNLPYYHEIVIEFLAFVSDIAFKVYFEGVSEAPEHAVACIIHALNTFEFNADLEVGLKNFVSKIPNGLSY
ncbi:hypothetical protein NPIL_2701 [Nephila pilipes]|uniref:Uncharacterized protein n=1 Tax=Nephila pilipes TaxID=299642 RepID=A0A8X6TSL0_NEPPI|nr:hypothetical protein NPIL_2701 [Nephila pilipes]